MDSRDGYGVHLHVRYQQSVAASWANVSGLGEHRRKDPQNTMSRKLMPENSSLDG